MTHSTPLATPYQSPAADPTPFVRGLQQLLTYERLHYILQRTHRTERRVRRLPAHAVVWLLVAMGLFSSHSIPQAFRALHPSRDLPEPDDSAFTKARQRLGVATVRQAFDHVAAMRAPADLPGVCYRRWRLMGLDGTVLEMPDTPDNAAVFGRAHNQHAPAAFPQVRVLALCELGTHHVVDLALRPLHIGEPSMVLPVLRQLGPNQLLLWDRNFFSYELITAVQKTGCDLLARVKASQLVLQRHQELPDGSYLSKIYPSATDRRQDRHGVVVRLIEYTHDDPQRPGCGERHRLLTTLLTPADLPARTAPLVYHERWEVELVWDEIKTHLQERALDLRSKTPRGVVQEIYGLVLAHRIVRQVMLDAAVLQGVDPDRLSFLNSVRIVQRHLPETPQRPAAEWYARLVREVSWQELRPRRERWYPRVIKRKVSKWPKKGAEHQQPPQPTKPVAAAVLIL